MARGMRYVSSRRACESAMKLAMKRSQESSALPQLHYGPFYGDGPLPHGDSLALCRPGPTPGSLTTHKPWVTCDACLKILEQRPWLK